MVTTSERSDEHGSPHDTNLEELDRIAEDLAGVEEALVRLDEGTYGRCEVCGGDIGDELLAEHPARSLCEAHLPVVGS